MTLRQAQLKLLAYIQDRIHNGELTERGFARLIGVSQPHVHNVLKGVRKLSPDVFDVILKTFNLALLDLFTAEELNHNLRGRLGRHVVDLPYLDTPIGPGMPWPSGISRRETFPMRFPSLPASGTLVMARLISDPHMHPTLAACDIALLNISERERSAASPEGVYAVRRGGEVVLRRVRPGSLCCYLVSDAVFDSPFQWEPVAARPNQLAGIIQARVVWLGREGDRHLPMHQCGRFLCEPISS